MGARYNVTKIATAVSTTNDSLTITAPAGRSLRILALRAYGGGAASAANELLIARSTGGVTPVAITPVPLNADSAAATFTAAGSWTTQPTIGVTIDRIGVNANGNYVPLIFPPGQEIEIPGGGQVTIRSASGTSLITLSATVEQI